ncbi:MAG: hypothetical protein QF752_07860 [Planctomycetota bacterium]|nr:hypothetical protein [Planctomycetota bacterium]
MVRTFDLENEDEKRNWTTVQREAGLKEEKAPREKPDRSGGGMEAKRTEDSDDDSEEVVQVDSIDAEALRDEHPELFGEVAGANQKLAELLKGQRKVKTIDLTGTNIDRAGLKVIAAQTQLKKLVIQNCPSLSHKKGIIPQILSTLTNLRYLTLRVASVSGKVDLTLLGSLRQLTHLDLSEPNNVVMNADAFPGVDLKAQNNTMFHRSVNQSMGFLANLTMLESLDLSDQSTVHGGFLFHIRELRSLRILRLRDLDYLRSSQIENLRGLEQLEVLILNKACYLNRKHTLEVGDTLRSLSNLRKLDLGDMTDSWYGGIPNEICDAVGTLTQLEWLSLRHNKIDSRGLPYLHTLKKLKYLDLTENTTEREAWFVKADGRLAFENLLEALSPNLNTLKFDVKGGDPGLLMSGMFALKGGDVEIDLGLKNTTSWTANEEANPGLFDRETADAKFRELLTQLAEYAPHLREFNLSGTKITGESLEVLSLFEGVTSLNLNDTKITNAGLAKLVDLENVKENLRFISLSKCRNITDSGLVHLGNLVDLEFLTITQCSKIQGNGLQHLGKLVNLISLDFRPAYWVGSYNTEISFYEAKGPSKAALGVLANFRKLLSLQLTLGYKVKGDGSLKFLKKLNKLRNLEIYGNKCKIDGAKFLEYLLGKQHLIDLHLEGFSLGDSEASFTHLKDLNKLSSLTLKNCGITGVALDYVFPSASEEPLFPELRELNVSDNPEMTSLGNLGAISGLKAVKYLNIKGGDLALKSLGGCSWVTAIHAKNWSITNEGLAFLASSTSLRTLSLADQQGVTNDGLHHLSGLTDLIYLDLSSTGISRSSTRNDEATYTDGVAHLSGLTNLQTLKLDSTNLTDTGMNFLSGLSKLTYLSLSNTSVTDITVGYLSGCAELQRLDLADTGVTAQDLSALSSKPLRDLDLTGCSLNATSLEQIQTLSFRPGSNPDWYSDMTYLTISLHGIAVEDYSKLYGLKGVKILTIYIPTESDSAEEQMGEIWENIPECDWLKAICPGYKSWGPTYEWDVDYGGRD